MKDSVLTNVLFVVLVVMITVIMLLLKQQEAPNTDGTALHKEELNHDLYGKD